MAYIIPDVVPLIQKGKLITDGLVACYPMQGEAMPFLIDVSGHSRSGLAYGDTPDGNQRIGSEFGGALNFVRANTDCVDMGAETFGNTAQGTICAWVSLGAIANTEYHALFGFGGGVDVTTPGGLGIQVYKDSGTEAIRILQRTDGEGTWSIGVISPVSFASAGWKHLSFTSDGSTWNVYINGVAQSLSFTSGSNNGDWFADTTVNTPSLIIAGARFDGTLIHLFNGAICDFRAYNRDLSQYELMMITAGLG